MINAIFQGVLDTQPISAVSVADFLLCLGVALLAGFFSTWVYTCIDCSTKSFLLALAVTPAMVCAAIIMVNGNVGTGVAVAGIFSLVRFRSAQGTAQEICAIFMATCVGLIIGIGYLGHAVVFSIVLGGIILLYNKFWFGSAKGDQLARVLHITIPEDLDYPDVFEPILVQYSTSHELIQVRTTNLGSLFRLTYNLTLKEPGNEKELIDKLRCRNGNLEISISKQDTEGGGL